MIKSKKIFFLLINLLIFIFIFLGLLQELNNTKNLYKKEVRNIANRSTSGIATNQKIILTEYINSEIKEKKVKNYLLTNLSYEVLKYDKKIPVELKLNKIKLNKFIKSDKIFYKSPDKFIYQNQFYNYFILYNFNQKLIAKFTLNYKELFIDIIKGSVLLLFVSLITINFVLIYLFRNEKIINFIGFNIKKFKESKLLYEFKRKLYTYLIIIIIFGLIVEFFNTYNNSNDSVLW